MAKPKPITLAEDRDSPQKYGGAVYHLWKFQNPKGAKVRCEAVSGIGEISLYKNNTKIGLPYQISSEAGPPTAVHLNTGNWDSPRSITVQNGDTLLQIAVRFGVTVSSIVAKNGIENPDVINVGQQLKIPDSEWEVWIKELGPGKNKFKVKLLTFES